MNQAYIQLGPEEMMKEVDQEVRRQMELPESSCTVRPDPVLPPRTGDAGTTTREADHTSPPDRCRCPGVLLRKVGPVGTPRHPGNQSAARVGESLPGTPSP